MIVDCISDLHGYYPPLEGGDLLIIAGDLTARDEIEQYFEFNEWLKDQDYERKIVIGGNHDNYLELGAPVNIFPGKKGKFVPILADKAIYLCDSGTEFVYYPPLTNVSEQTLKRKTYKIWGSPWTTKFRGMNPKCMAFTVDSDEELSDKWNEIPDSTDILVTHSPPHGILDIVKRSREGDEFCGSVDLRNQVFDRIKPRLHVFGHIHEWGGKLIDCTTTIMVNASHVNARYEPVNKPVRVIL